MYKRCKICQKFFTTLNKQSIYCINCRGKKNYYKKEERIEKECDFCGGTFFTTRSNQRFCIDRCRAKFHENKIAKNKNCLRCGKQFITTNNSRQYCCNRHYLITKRERDHKNYMEKKK